MIIMKKILIIEDEAAYLKLLQDKLTANGYEVIEATDGKKGLAMAKKENPDLILLDVRMPGMDGMKMLNVLCKEDACKKIKIIILSNLELDDKTTRGVDRDEPAQYFVKSDIRFSELLEKIKELLGE